MENYHLTNRRLGHVLQELWHMDSKGGDITFYLTVGTFDLIKEFLNDEVAAKQLFLFDPSAEEMWGNKYAFFPLHKTEDGGHSFSITLKDQVDQEKRKEICSDLSNFLNILELIGRDEGGKHTAKKGEQIQLFSLSTIHLDEPRLGGGYLSFSVSPEAARFLEQQSGRTIPGVHEAMKAHHLGIFPKDKEVRPLEFLGGLVGTIRNHGTLDFKTLGNCACMGAMPREATEDEGSFIDAHNVDSSWQQLSLIVGLATTWKWVRDELGYK